LVVKNLNYGVFNLKLSHLTDKNSTSYKQKNFMTQLHWGDAKQYVAKRDLLAVSFTSIARIRSRQNLRLKSTSLLRHPLP